MSSSGTGSSGSRFALALYWDASAILSSLFRDAHSDEAMEWAKRDGVHLLSSLAYTEVCAVIARLGRERRYPDVLLGSAQGTLEAGPWRRLSLLPDSTMVRKLAPKWPVRGADLWHLATALTLRRELPELAVLTFDHRMAVAADGEGFKLPA
jgi:predicted nucleic acid-binding protein